MKPKIDLEGLRQFVKDGDEFRNGSDDVNYFKYYADQESYIKSLPLIINALEEAREIILSVMSACSQCGGSGEYTDRVHDGTEEGHLEQFQCNCPFVEWLEQFEEKGK